MALTSPNFTQINQALERDESVLQGLIDRTNAGEAFSSEDLGERDNAIAQVHKVHDDIDAIYQSDMRASDEAGLVNALNRAIKLMAKLANLEILIDGDNPPDPARNSKKVIAQGLKQRLGLETLDHIITAAYTLLVNNIKSHCRRTSQQLDDFIRKNIDNLLLKTMEIDGDAEKRRISPDLKDFIGSFGRFQEFIELCFMQRFDVIGQTK